MDLDFTLIIQLTIFVSLFAILNKLLFLPFLKVIEARHEKIHGLKEVAERLLLLNSEDKSKYQQKLSAARFEAHKTRENWLKKGRDEERRLLTLARAHVADSLVKARANLQHEAEGSRQELRAQTDVISNQIIQKILGRALT